MAEFLRLVALAVQVVLLFFRYRYDPERLKLELQTRIDHEQKLRQQTFRDAVERGDEDAVSRMLADARDRARDARLQSGASGGDLPPGDRQDGPPDGR